MSEEVKAKVKALFPEDVEGIYISKNDYDRLYGDLTLENIELKQEIERLNNKVDELMELYTTERHCKDDYKSIIKEVREYIEDDRLYMSNGNVLSIANTGCGKKILEILDKGGKQ